MTIHTFEQKPKAAQQTTSAKSTIPSRAHFGQSPELNSILHLQRTIGNQAVLRMLQTDAGQSEAGLTEPALPRLGHDFSRIPIHPPTAGAIQTRLAINELGDSYEQEADRIAEQVMRTPEPKLQLAYPCGGGRPNCHTKQPGWEHESLQTKRIQASDTGQIAALAPPIVHEVLRSPGQPLDPATRAFMEAGFGYDFSRVRVHSDTVAAQSAKNLRAEAYVAGWDIIFGASRFRPQTQDGRRLLAHELTHTIQQAGLPMLVQRKPEKSDQATSPVPSWALTTPADALPGVPVPGYEVERPNYSESDRSTMLVELNERIQTNGQRLADFYDDFRDAWIDLVINLAVAEAGFSFAEQTVFAILNNALTAPMGPGLGFAVGVLADTVVNAVGTAKADAELDERKKTLRDMMDAPSVKDVGSEEARGQLAGFLLDAVAYATWLQVANLEDLGKFRIPPEFPRVPASAIRAQIAAAVIRYKSPALSTDMLKATASEYGTFVGGVGGGLFKILPEGVLQIAIHQGWEEQIAWNLSTHPSLLSSIIGHRIEELKDPKGDQLPVVVKFVGHRLKGVNLPRDYGEYFPKVIFGRNTAGVFVFHEGNLLGLYQLYRYCHPFETLTREDVWAYEKGHHELRSQHLDSLWHHYRKSAECGANVIFQSFIDPFVLRRPRPGWSAYWLEETG